MAIPELLRLREPKHQHYRSIAQWGATILLFLAAAIFGVHTILTFHPTTFTRCFLCFWLGFAIGGISLSLYKPTESHMRVSVWASSVSLIATCLIMYLYG